MKKQMAKNCSDKKDKKDKKCTSGNNYKKCIEGTKYKKYTTTSNNNTSANNNNNDNNSADTTAFELNLINQERVGDLLFLIGTILAFIVANQGELATLQTDEQKKESLRTKALRTLSIESWIFFVASLIFASTAIARLKQLESEPNKTQTISDLKLLNGNKISTLGGILKSTGFGLAAIGNQMKYDSTKKK